MQLSLPSRLSIRHSRMAAWWLLLLLLLQG
jgi:hypothetical protein